MKFHSFGKSGLQVSALSFGAWATFGNQVDVDMAANLMKPAYNGVVIFYEMLKFMPDGRRIL